MARPGFRSFLLLIALVGLARPLHAQVSNIIRGTVVARSTGEPIAGATVAIEGSGNVTTNGVGRFELDQPASVTVVVSAPGYVTARVSNLTARTPVAILLDLTPNFMERVQVTATKTSESVGDTAAAPTTIIDRTTIDRRNDQRLTEAVEHVPGALVTTELGIFESVLLRGMPRVGNEFTNTLLLVDGIPQTNAGNDARVVALPIYDAANIEVVRGPNSALYGRTAIGGAINILTAEPAAKPEFKVDLTGGQFGTAKGVVTASGPIQQWGGYYASLGRTRSGGYYKNLLDDDFDLGNTSFFGKFKFAPDPRSVGSVTLNRVTSANSTPTNEPIIDGALLHDLDPAFERFTSFNLPGPNYAQHETRFTVNYRRQLTRWAHVVETFGYRDVQRDFIEDGDFIGEPYSLENQTVTMYPFNQQTEDRNLYQEARLEVDGRRGGMRHQVIFGGSYERNAGNSSYDGLLTDEDTFGFPDFSYVNPVVPDRSLWMHDRSSVEYRVGITGIFGQYLVEPVNRLVVTLAGRYDRLALDAIQGTAAPVEKTYEAFSPKVGATVRLIETNDSASGWTLNAFGTYSQAFLPPRRPSALQAADTALNLQPEDIENYEAGLKGSALGGRVALEASYFRMTEDGVVINRFINNRFIPSNAGQLRYKGFETGATWTPRQSVTAYANAAFYRNRYGDFVIQTSGGDRMLTGNRLVLSPDYIVNWGMSLQPVSAVNVTFDVKHVSSTFGNDSNTAKIDGYALFDVAATWQRGPLRVTLSGRNLFSKDYYFDVGSESADPGPPRQVLLSTTVRLGR
jgi:outer membrane receptor protein involved in Fe transport